MLKSLSIKNFAVIQALEIDFGAGLNLLTGETGSGKSIIVDALGLLLGGRSSTNQIRTGERTAVVEGTFKLSEMNGSEAQTLLELSGHRGKIEQELLIKRELSITGRSRILVNERVVPISVLRALQPFLVEIHGQGEHRALLSTQSQLELLDQFANCLSLKEKVFRAYTDWRAAKEALSLLESEAAVREKASDFLQYQLSEIETLDPKANEDEALQTERKLLTHAETALQLASSAYFDLYESEASVLSRLAAVRKRLEELGRIDVQFVAAAEALTGDMASISDIADILRNYGSKLDFSPARLAEIDERLAELERVKRKYNTNLEGLLKVSSEVSERLAGFNEIAAREPLLRAALETAEADYRSLADKLSHCRHLAKDKLEQRVMNDLKHLAMENAQFIVAIAPGDSGASDNAQRDLVGQNLQGDSIDSNNGFTANGMDQVEFLLSANAGESPRPLAHVASGGELSRLMLTLRTIGRVNKKYQQGGETLVFDEIDVGIGGRVAEAVGRRLKALAQTRQVLCVTHQPQIARFADHHYLIAKIIEQGRTKTIVKELNADERVGELARMIGGDEQALTTRETARWLLDNSIEKKRRSKPSGKSSKL